MKNQKAFQKSQLICEFGILMQPLEELVRAEQPPSPEDYRVAIAKVQAGDARWRTQVKEFTTFAPDIFFQEQHQDISHVPEYLLRVLRKLRNQELYESSSGFLRGRVKEELASARKSFFEFIDRIPIEWEPVVFEANTPFTSYLRIRESIVAVKDRLHYFDRYLKPEFFQLFLASVDNAVSIRLVTTAGDARYGVEGVAAVSNLARQQFDDYRLIEVGATELHDRNLRVDDRIFTLGTGIDRAGMTLTNFGPSDNSRQAHTVFDRIIAGGHVVS